MGNVRTVPTKVELTYSVTVDIPETEWHSYRDCDRKVLCDMIFKEINGRSAVFIPHDWELVDVEVMGEKFHGHD